MLAFDPALTSVAATGAASGSSSGSSGATGPKVTFSFQTNKPALVYYSLVINVNQVGVLEYLSAISKNAEFLCSSETLQPGRSHLLKS